MDKIVMAILGFTIGIVLIAAIASVSKDENKSNISATDMKKYGHVCYTYYREMECLPYGGR